MARTYGYQPTSDATPSTPPSEPAGASSANPITYEDLQISLVLGRGIVVDSAPEYTKITLELFASSPMYVRYSHRNKIRIAEQVAYEVTGYDPADCALTLRLVRDWRPGQKDAPAADPQTEDTSDLDITEYLIVHRYRRDRGDWAWSYRCFGDGGCGGFLSLDWLSRESAEREAREHLAGHPPVAAMKTAVRPADHD